MTANVWDKNTVLVVMSSTSHNSQLTALAIDSTNGSEPTTLLLIPFRGF